ncbi:MAG: YtxH domain-containing protein [bacterium]|nr:YtxH domain-containing protein [bacterium]
MWRTIKALFAGIIAGTALGVLFSPKKGKDIRKNISDEIDQGGTGLRSIKDTLFGVGHEISETDAYKQVSSEAKKAQKKAAKAVKSKISAEQRKQAGEAIRKAKATARKATKKAKTVINKAKKKFSE